ncbi:hypothetical protein CRG98_028982 [Punica granatum]|uniref:Uncharacterized protein n=1 Tax=Punica granatum TaxID=22663 RepID=A0A2I0J2Y4_PUNGR|nr:hypothetical protein CRG98_028982 [Punica granatum]
MGVATTAREGARDDGEYRLGYATFGMGVTKLGTVGIEGNFEFFWRRGEPARGKRRPRERERDSGRGSMKGKRAVPWRKSVLAVASIAVGGQPRCVGEVTNARAISQKYFPRMGDKMTILTPKGWWVKIGC